MSTVRQQSPAYLYGAPESQLTQSPRPAVLSAAAAVAPVAPAWLTQDFPNPADGQTLFVLPGAPTTPAATQIVINSVPYSGADVTVIGKNVTWNNRFAISGADTVYVKYY